MNTHPIGTPGTGTISLRRFATIARVLIGAASLVACGPGSGATEADGGSQVARDSSIAKPDARAAQDATRDTTGQQTDGGPPTSNGVCTVADQCQTGFCIDGVCCDVACDQPCQSCALAGTLGTCSPVKNADDDTCNAESTCSASGTCLKALGKTCAGSSDCASGNCVDGVCCGSAACGECHACAVAGSEGKCAPLAQLAQTATCSGKSACDGLGVCRSNIGSSCSGSSGNECASHHCADGVCCDTACDGACYSCNQKGLEGYCEPLVQTEDYFPAAVCAGTKFCDVGARDMPICKPKLADAQPCTHWSECLHGTCDYWYPDADGDGFGNYSGGTRLCGATPPPGFSDVYGDCCDADASTHPGQTEFSSTANLCGSVDRNCDGIAEPAAPPGVGWR